MRRVWRPTMLMRKFAEAAASLPGGSKADWARAIDVKPSQAQCWFSKPKFVSWFNAQMLSPLQDKSTRVFDRLADICLGDDPPQWAFELFVNISEKFNFGGIREEERKDAALNGGSKRGAMTFNFNLVDGEPVRRREIPAEVIDAKLLEHDDD